MKLSEFGDTIVSSDKSDWTVEACWGGGAGPSYRYSIGSWVNIADSVNTLEVKVHTMIASYKPNLSISMAWGIEHNNHFVEDWTDIFHDQSSSSSFIDFFYNGVLVFRDIYVSVDGGRVSIPLPDISFRDSNSGERDRILSVPRSKVDFFRMLNAMETSIDFDRYMKKVGFDITDELWIK